MLGSARPSFTNPSIAGQPRDYLHCNSRTPVAVSVDTRQFGRRMGTPVLIGGFPSEMALCTCLASRCVRSLGSMELAIVLSGRYPLAIGIFAELLDSRAKVGTEAGP